MAALAEQKSVIAASHKLAHATGRSSLSILEPVGRGASHCGAQCGSEVGLGRLKADSHNFRPSHLSVGCSECHVVASNHPLVSGLSCKNRPVEGVGLVGQCRNIIWAGWFPFFGCGCRRTQDQCSNQSFQLQISKQQCLAHVRGAGTQCQQSSGDARDAAAIDAGPIIRSASVLRAVCLSWCGG